MHKFVLKYGLLVLVLLSLVLCQRVEPEFVDLDTKALQSELHDRFSFLDTTLFSYSHQYGQIYYFQYQGTDPAYSKGDYLAYVTNEHKFFGRLSAVVHEGGLLGLELEPVSVNAIFNYLTQRDTIRSGNGNMIVQYNESVVPHQDSMQIFSKKLEIREDIIVQGYVQVDSCTIMEQSLGENISVVLPAWESMMKTHEIKLEWNKSIDISGCFTFYSLDGLLLSDSMLVRKQVFSSHDADEFPVEYVIEDWLVFHWTNSGAGLSKIELDLAGQSDILATIRSGDNWNLNPSMNFREAAIDVIGWNSINPLDIAIEINTAVYPMFCGIAGPRLNQTIQMSLQASSEWPAWQKKSEIMAEVSLLSNQNAFDDIPVATVIVTPVDETIHEENGVLENESPVPVLEISPGTGYTDTNFKLNASQSTDREDPTSLLQCRWDYNGDLEWDTPFSTNKVVYQRYLIPNTYEVRVEVRDTQGASAIETRTVTVHNTTSAPIAVFSITPESGQVAEFFTFDASECYDAEDQLSALEVRWDFQNDGEWDTHFSTTKAAVWVYTLPETYVVKLEVRDTDGLTGSTTKLLVVESANIKPTAFFTVNPEMGDTETRFNFDASGSSDPEDPIEELQVRWDWENDGVWDTQFRYLKTITHQFDEAGFFVVVLDVLDRDGYSNTYSKEIEVTNPNTPPVADFTITPTRGTVDTKFTFDASISTDGEDDLNTLEVRWDWDNVNPYDTEYSSDKTITRQFDEVGTYIIRLMVQDSGGLTSTKARIVIVE